MISESYRSKNSKTMDKDVTCKAEILASGNQAIQPSHLVDSTSSTNNRVSPWKHLNRSVGALSRAHDPDAVSGKAAQIVSRIIKECDAAMPKQ